jgi:hypothetical protein
VPVEPVVATYVLRAVRGPDAVGATRIMRIGWAVGPPPGDAVAVVTPNVQLEFRPLPPIRGVGAEDCAIEPVVLLAVTTARIANPTSNEVNL